MLIVCTSWLSCFCFVFSLLLLLTFFPHSLGNLCHPLVEVQKKKLLKEWNLSLV